MLRTWLASFGGRGDVRARLLPSPARPARGYEEVANIACFSLRRSFYVTGAVIPVDGRDERGLRDQPRGGAPASTKVTS